MNYTYAQLKQMQEDASRRVMEMRRRADVAAGQSDEDMALDLPGPDRAPGPSRAAKKTDDEKRSEVILDSVITMAKKLGMTVIAEGVESREQMEFLSSMGCDIFQGYYFSVPLPPDEFERKYMKD